MTRSLILTKGATKKDWTPVLKEAQPFLKVLGEDKIDIKPLRIPAPPKQEYKPGYWGVNKTWLTSMVAQYGEGYEEVIWHDADFDVQGAWGYFHRALSTPQLRIMQMFRHPTVLNPHYDEFHFDLARTLVHEYCHMYAYIRGITDRTHEFQSKDDLMAWCEYIAKIKAENHTSLARRVIKLQRQAIALYKQLIGHYEEEEVICGCEEPQALKVLHHSATSMTRTKPETIEKNHMPIYGRSFYSKIIDHKGNLHIMHNELNPRKGIEPTDDILALGDFRKGKDVPTPAMIKRLRQVLGKDWTTHKVLGERGHATKSSCPGELATYINN